MIEGRPVRILLVEDNPGDVLLTQEAFADAAISNEIHVAYDGEEALAYLRKEGDNAQAKSPDLVLLDLNLPKKSGHDVLKDIKGDPELSHLPVIVLSSSRAETDVLKSYRLHASSYLAKPNDMSELSAIVGAIERFWFSVVLFP